MPQGHEMIGQAFRSLEGPRLEGGQELRLVDQAVLQGQEPEEELAVGGDGCHEVSLPGGRRGRSADGPRRRWPPLRYAASTELSHGRSEHAAPLERADSPRRRARITGPGAWRPEDDRGGPDRGPSPGMASVPLASP